MKSVINWLQSITRTTESTESTKAQQSTLYACKSCGSVYVATEKETCSKCETPVEQVPATLEDT